MVEIVPKGVKISLGGRLSGANVNWPYCFPVMMEVSVGLVLF